MTSGSGTTFIHSETTFVSSRITDHLLRNQVPDAERSALEVQARHRRSARVCAYEHGCLTHLARVRPPAPHAGSAELPLPSSVHDSLPAAAAGSSDRPRYFVPLALPSIKLSACIHCMQCSWSAPAHTREMSATGRVFISSGLPRLVGPRCRPAGDYSLAIGANRCSRSSAVKDPAAAPPPASMASASACLRACNSATRCSTVPSVSSL